MRRNLDPPVPEKGPEDIGVFVDQQMPLVNVPWNGTTRVMRLRRLSQNQLRAAVGDVPLNWGGSDPGHGAEKQTIGDIISILDSMDMAAQAVMVEPSYQDMVDAIDAVRPDGKTRAAALAEIDAIRDKMAHFNDPDHPEVVALQAEADRVRMMEKYFLPEDTYGFLFSFALRADDHDMRAYTEASMIEHAIISERTSSRPCDIAGIDAEKGYLREQYDRSCIVLLERHREINKKTGGKIGRR